MKNLPLLLTAICAFAATAESQERKFPTWVQYEKVITVTGTLTEELYAKDARMNRRKKPVILRLDEPVSVRANPEEPIDTEEKDVAEFHLLLEDGDRESLSRSDFDNQLFTATGVLHHAHAAHHLRPITMIVSKLKRYPVSLSDILSNPAVIKMKGQVWTRVQVLQASDRKVIYEFLNDTACNTGEPADER